MIRLVYIQSVPEGHELNNCTCLELFDGIEIQCSSAFLQKIPQPLYINSSAFNCTSNNHQVFKIDLSKNLIDIINTDAFANKSRVTDLDLSKNAIRIIDKNAFLNIGNCLKILKLNDNKLNHTSMEDFNWVMQTLESLEILDLSGNNLEQLPDFRLNQNLKKIVLNSNKLETISATSLPVSLQEFSASYNKIKSFEWVNGLTQLKLLNLSFNSIERIHAINFKNTINLYNIDLSKNKIELIEKMAFFNLPVRVSLNLSHQAENTTIFIDNYAFDKNVTQFQKEFWYIDIDLSGNIIELMEPRAFCSRVVRGPITIENLRIGFERFTTLEICTLNQIEYPLQMSQTTIFLNNMACSCFTKFLELKFSLHVACASNFQSESCHNFYTFHNVCGQKNYNCFIEDQQMKKHNWAIISSNLYEKMSHRLINENKIYQHTPVNRLNTSVIKNTSSQIIVTNKSTISYRNASRIFNYNLIPINFQFTKTRNLNKHNSSQSNFITSRYIEISKQSTKHPCLISTVSDSNNMVFNTPKLINLYFMITMYFYCVK